MLRNSSYPLHYVGIGSWTSDCVMWNVCCGLVNQFNIIIIHSFIHSFRHMIFYPAHRFFFLRVMVPVWLHLTSFRDDKHVEKKSKDFFPLFWIRKGIEEGTMCRGRENKVKEKGHFEKGQRNCEKGNKDFWGSIGSRHTPFRLYAVRESVSVSFRSPGAVRTPTASCCGN